MIFILKILRSSEYPMYSYKSVKKPDSTGVGKQKVQDKAKTKANRNLYKHISLWTAKSIPNTKDNKVIVLADIKLTWNIKTNAECTWFFSTRHAVIHFTANGHRSTKL